MFIIADLYRIVRRSGAGLGVLFRHPAAIDLPDTAPVERARQREGVSVVLRGSPGSLGIAPAVLFAFAFALCAPLSAKAAAEAGKPNIVVIAADDLGYGDITSYGGPVSTPNIDALARAGVRFTDFHANGPVCTPSRAALLTGRYPQRAQLGNALSASSNEGLNANQITLGDVLKAAGYRTGIVGKWHLGHLAKFAPGRQGFDFFYGFLNGEIDYVNHLDSLGKPDWWRNTTPISENIYSTTAITREAVGFIQRQQRQPFFLYVAFQAPHLPYQAPGDGPVRVPGQPKHGEEGNKANYPLMIQAMDRGVGTIMNTLRALNLEQDTFVLFLSDNGAFAPGTNRPLRGVKGQLYEGGHRVPAIAYWPGRIAPSVNRETVAAIDLFPTVLGLASAKVPEAHRVDGNSFLPVLLGKEAALPARKLFWMYGGNTAAREGEWKLVKINGQTALYNLNADIGETTNVAAKYPGITASLSNAINKWKADVTAQPAVSVSMQTGRGAAEAAGAVILTAEPASDEVITRVEFWVNEVHTADVTTAPYTFNWQGAAPGAYSIKAKAFNVQGTMGVSQPVSIVVPARAAG